jgi:cyclohexyl-isocyanide hydratase
MRAAFVLFDQLTALDFVGIYDPLTRLKSMGFLSDFGWELCGRTPEVEDDRGLRFRVSAVGGTLAGYDLLVVPGGVGTRTMMRDPAFMGWLRTAAPVPLKVSVCSGALLLGSAGFLERKRATTHPNSLQDLAPMCAAALEARIVDEGSIITAGGVTAALDVGLHVVERLAGPEIAGRIRRQMDYPYSVASLDRSS